MPGEVHCYRDRPRQMRFYAAPGCVLWHWPANTAKRHACGDFSRLDSRPNGGNGNWNRTKWHRPTHSRLMTNPPETRKLLAQKHNGASGGQVMEAVLESAVRMGADLVLIQEPRGEREKDSTRSHGSFMFIRGEVGEPAKCWIAVNQASRCRVTEMKDMTRNSRNHVQVIEVTPPGMPTITIASVYDQWRDRGRPAQRANWGAIARSAQVIIAGDMNAQTQITTASAYRTERGREFSFWTHCVRAFTFWTQPCHVGGGFRPLRALRTLRPAGCLEFG